MELLVLNTNLDVVAIIDTFISLIWTDRYNSCGDFELCLPVTSYALEYLKTDYCLQIKESEHSMVIEELSIESDVEEGDRLIVTGRSIESILDRRIIWNQTVLNGNFQESIRKLLIDAIIAPSITNRKIANFIFEPSDDIKITGLTIDAQFTGTDLYSVVSELCTKNNIGFKIVLNDTKQFVFSLYAGSDHSYAQSENPYVVFSPSFENLLNSDYITSNVNVKNVALVAGEDQGLSRKTASVGDENLSGLERRELFVDARDISSDLGESSLTLEEYLVLLKTRGYTKLAECTVKTAFEGELETTKSFEYGKDYFIGDIVQITTKYGQEGTVYISEFILSQSNDKISGYPTFQTI